MPVGAGGVHPVPEGLRHEPTPSRARLRVLSFGYGHTGGRGPLDATVTLDLRRLLRDPHTDPHIRQLTGADPAVPPRCWPPTARPG